MVNNLNIYTYFNHKTKKFIIESGEIEISPKWFPCDSIDPNYLQILLCNINLSMEYINDSFVKMIAVILPTSKAENKTFNEFLEKRLYPYLKKYKKFKIKMGKNMCDPLNTFKKFI